MPKSSLYTKLQKQFGWKRLTRRERRLKNKKDLLTTCDSERNHEQSPSEILAPRKRKLALPIDRNVKSPRLSPKLIDEDIDPISLCKLGKNRFTCFQKDGVTKVTSFDPKNLIKYILSSGDFTNPTTRIEFTDSELARLDECGAAVGLKTSVLALRKDETYCAAIKERQFRRDALCGLDRCLGEVVNKMVNLIENCSNSEVGEIQLASEYFPKATHYLNQIAKVDAEFARQCAVHYLDFTIGPPNRPTEDPEGLKSAVVRFLQTAVNSAGKNEKGYLKGFHYNEPQGEEKEGQEEECVSL
eukprot:g283.t1